MAKFQPGGTMPDRLDDFQKFRADLNEEILSCGTRHQAAFLPSTIKPTSPARSAPRPRSFLAWSPGAVLRCDELASLPSGRLRREGWKRDEVIDGPLKSPSSVGGSITIPARPRAFARMREIDGLKNS